MKELKLDLTTAAILFWATVLAPNAKADLMTSFASTFITVPPNTTIKSASGTTSAIAMDSLVNGGTVSASTLGSLPLASMTAAANVPNASFGGFPYTASAAAAIGVTYDFNISGPTSGILLVWGSLISDYHRSLTGCTGPFCDSSNSGATLVLGKVADVHGFVDSPAERFAGIGSGSNQYSSPNGTIIPIGITVPFVNSLGTFDLALFETATCAIRDGVACSASATTTMTILGAEVLDSTGNLAPAATISSSSGFTPAIVPPVPEPNSLYLLMTIVLGSLCLVRKRRAASAQVKGRGRFLGR
jgi:hypothetical protein